MVRLGFCIALLFAACAATQARPNLPGTFGSGETLPPPVAPEADGALAPVAVPAVPVPAPGAGTAAPDPGAEADFREAKARFDAGAQADARKALEGFVAHHGQHPFRPAVDLMLARLALLRGDAAAAKRQLEPLVATPPDPGTASSARYYLGLSEVRLGQYARGRELLLPFLPTAGAAGPGDEALVELRGALAEATSATGELTAALELWDGFARGGRDHEKAYARSRAGELAADVAPDAAARAWRASAERGLARAVLGTKAAAYVRAQGDAQGAAAIDAETAAARKAMGFEEAQAAQGSGDTGRLGLAIALTGKFQPVGEAAMRAAMLAVGAPAKVAMATPAPAPSGAAMQLFVRDTGGEPERASRGVAELAHDEAVIGILSATDRKAAATSLAAASENGVPTLALDDTPPGATSTAFQLIHAPEARVAALARAGLKAGARDFAMLGPDSAAGKRLRDAFRREVTGAGGRITGDASYAPGATSFGTQVAAIKKTPPQVVFVADGADRLELIAPALAAADLWAAPWGAARPAGAPGAPRPRNVLLLSTAAEPSPRLIQNAGRYLQGALLAPGFYAAAGDARARAFVEAYRATYGSEPHATEAYAYDGANAFRAVTAAGARTRGDVLNALGAGTFEGLTGALRFGPDHGRIDPPRLYVISGDEIKPF
jgi:ABC-type branched-subunit amino acid transport system substrate-binding protein